jgi:glutamyl/glutaminyl-tRNA synthetase
VIRGADHLTNTSKHVLLFEALGETVPHFVHLPLILGTDKKRLSKRHGATSVLEYQELGFLPEAVCSYLALLGWSPGDGKELLSKQEMVERFRLDRISRANAIFDLSKAEWTNKRFISVRSSEELGELVRLELERSGLWQEKWQHEARSEYWDVLELLKSRVQSLRDFPVYGRAFFTDDFEYEEKAVVKFLCQNDPEVRETLKEAVQELSDSYSKLPNFDLESTEKSLRAIAEKYGLKAGQLIGAVRVASTGRSQAPGIFDVLIVLGRNKTLERLGRLSQYLR